MIKIEMKQPKLTTIESLPASPAEAPPRSYERSLWSSIQPKIESTIKQTIKQIWKWIQQSLPMNPFRSLSDCIFMIFVVAGLYFILKFLHCVAIDEEELRKAEFHPSGIISLSDLFTHHYSPIAAG